MPIATPETMTPALSLFVAMTITLAALLVTWIAGLVMIVRKQRRLSIAAIVPPLTIVQAWREGAHGIAIAIGALAVLYGALWISALAGHVT